MILRRAAFICVAFATSTSACLVQSEPGPKGDPGASGDQGPQGLKGDPGTPGVPDSEALAALQQKVDQLQLKLDALEKSTTAPECPIGYLRDVSVNKYVVCLRATDEVVRVGVGGSSFWIDRYEASIWTTSDGPMTGQQKFTTLDDSSVSFPKGGQISMPLFAVSVPNVIPATRVTWFQAQEACAASDEWLRAARGTFDPGANTGAVPGNTKCNTDGAVTRLTGQAVGATASNSCISDWGVQDMTGNVREWTAEWIVSVGDSTAGANTTWSDPSYGNDGIWNIGSLTCNLGFCSEILPLPSAGMRGGSSNIGELAGIFAFDLGYAPSAWSNHVGFRCELSR